MMRRAHAGRGFLRFGLNCVPLSPLWASVRNGLAYAAITGQRGKGFLGLFRIRRSRVLRVFWIMGVKSMGIVPGLWIGRWLFGASVPNGWLEEELWFWGLLFSGVRIENLSVSL